MKFKHTIFRYSFPCYILCAYLIKQLTQYILSCAPQSPSVLSGNEVPLSLHEVYVIAFIFPPTCTYITHICILLALIFTVYFSHYTLYLL